MRPVAIILTLALLSFTAVTHAQKPAALPPGDDKPVLRLEAGGPTSYVTALAFSPDGKKLYSAGLDKVVHVWTLNEKDQFVLDAKSPPLRLPIGPGLNGAINAIALSDDGKWLAVGGQGVYRGMAGFRAGGIFVPGEDSFDDVMRQDQGLIFAFNLDDGSVKVLRGHTGPVRNLTFAPQHTKKPPLLLSAGHEWNGKTIVGGVRLWDVENPEKALAEQTTLPAFTTRPALTAWHVGDDKTQVRAALAWGDTVLRIWDVSGGSIKNTAMDRKYLFTAASLGDPDKVLTAFAAGGKPQLREWAINGGDATASRSSDAPGVSRNAPLVWAHVLAPVSSKANGGFDRAAVVSLCETRGNEYRLHMLDLSADNFGKVTSELPLWSGMARRPVVATAPRGRFLALAGDTDNTIRIYAVADLEKKGELHQSPLRGAGESFGQAVLARKGKDLALVLRNAGKGKPGDRVQAIREGDLVFDFAGRKLSTNRAGWQISSPDTTGWDITLHADRTPVEIEISKKGEDARSIKMPPLHVVTDFAVLPPSAGVKVPLLVVASHVRGQPRLALYNGQTGSQLRQFTGHTEIIRSVAFSADGKLLVSTSADQTVSFWRLTNLDEIYNRRGMIPGLGVRQDDKGILVGRLEANSEAATKLRRDDRIEGIVEGEKLRALRTPTQLYLAASAGKPGDEIVLRVENRGDVRLKLGQGIDERKPLVSLFIARADKVEDRQWIGWNPGGTYDASGDGAEKLLGWHINTGDGKKPAQFSPAGQYRKEFFKEGFLAPTLVAAKLEIPAPPKPPQPEMTLSIMQDGKSIALDGKKQYLVRTPKVTLSVSINNRDLTSLRDVAWRLDGKAATKFDLDQPDGKALTVEVDLTRGTVHRLQVTARPREDETPDGIEEVQVRYQPSAPELRLAAELDAKVLQPEVPLKVLVKPGITDEKVIVKIRRLASNKDSVVVEPQTVTTELAAKVKLEPGDNELVIEAVNEKATAAFREEETQRLFRTVTYTVKDAPPKIVLSKVVMPGPPDRELKLPGGGVMIVNTPKVRIVGTITSEKGNLQEATIQAGKERAVALKGFEAGKQTLMFDEEIAIEPDRQTIHFRARTGTSDPGSASVEIEYRPVLPVLTAELPDKPIKHIFGKDPATYRLRATLGETDNKHDFTTTVLVNGKETDTKVTRDGRQLEADVPLAFGSNRIQLRIQNKWANETSEQIEVSHVRPPRVVSWKGEAKAMKAVVELEAEITSATALRGDSIVAQLRGQRLAPESLELIKPEADKPERWVIRLKRLMLEKGDNVVTLSVANEEDRSDVGRYRIEYTPPAPPVVTLRSPVDDQATEEGIVPVRFDVISEKPIDSAVVIRSGPNGESPREYRAKWLRQEGNRQLFEVEKVELLEGLNRIKVKAAAGEGGSAEKEGSISWKPRAVSVEVLALWPDRLRRNEIRPERKGGKLVFPEMPVGLVQLHGKVVWLKPDERLDHQSYMVRVHINGFQQLALLQPRDGKKMERTFQVNLVLSRKTGNNIEVSLKGLPEQEDASSSFVLDCAKPMQFQRLHLLMVNTDPKADAQKMKDEFLKSLRAEATTEGRYKSQAFGEIIPYGPLVGRDANPRRLMGELNDRIAPEIGKRPVSQDVVLFYFRGSEKAGEKGLVLGPVGKKTDRDSLVLQTVVRWCSLNPGAYLLLFDVDREKQPVDDKQKDEVANWNKDRADVKHLGVMRYAWLGGMQAIKDPRLLEVLQKALLDSHKLKELSEEVANAGKGAQPMGLQSDVHVPERVKEITVGMRRP